MKRDQTVKIVAAMAVLAILAQLRLAAQDQPQSPQPTQQKEERARNTLAAANYNLRIASAFLCDPSDSTTCPAAARAANGESIEISGAGTRSAASKSVTAAGAFTVKNPNGYILTIGVWTATGLVSFESYGIVPGALLRD